MRVQLSKILLLFLLPAVGHATSLIFTEDGTINGGTYQDVTIMNTATVGMINGSVYNMYIRNLGTLNFYNGVISQADVWDSGKFNLEGASFGNTLSLNNSSVFTLNNGLFDGLIYGYDYSRAAINGGQASGIEFDMSSYASADIYAGNVTIDFLSLHQYSTLNIYGGNVLFNNGFWLDDDAEITVFYSSIIRYKPEDPHSPIIGYKLLDGSDFMLDQFSQSEIEQINFVPEPATLLLVGIGGLFLRGRKRSI